MKRLLALFIVIFLLFYLLACDIPLDESALNEDPILSDVPVLHLEAQTLVGRWIVNQQYLTYTTYDAFLEFITFYQSKNSVPAYALDAFLDTYTEAFFETNDLFMMMFPEHVAISLEVTEMTMTEDILTIHVNHLFPETYPTGDTHIVYYSAIAIDKSLNVIDDVVIKHHMIPHESEHYKVFLFQQYGYDESFNDIYFNIYTAQTYDQLTTFFQSIESLYMTPDTFCDIGVILSCFAYGHPRLDLLIASYDQTYFENHMLIFVPMMESSGSIRHQLDFITVSDGDLLVGIKRLIPQIGTADMKGWLMVIEYPKPENPFETYAVEFSSVMPN